MNNQSMSKNMMLVIACISFFGLGWLVAALGPALDNLADNAHTTEGALGTIFLVSIVGALPAQGIVGAISDRFGQRSLLMLGVVVLSGTEVGVIMSRSLAVTIMFSMISGLGFASLDVGYNILIAEVFAGRANAMNLLHVFFGVGAIASPAFASQTLDRADTAITGLWVGAVLILLMLPLVYRLPRGVIKREAALETDADRAPTGTFSYRSPILWVLGGVMLIYVGIELGLNNWAKEYLERSTTLNASRAALGVSLFWLALSASRIFMAIFGDRFTAKQIVWVSTIGSMVGGLLLAISTGNVALSMAGIVISALFYGPVYPTIMLIATGTFRSGPGKAASVVAMMGGIGGGVLPWLQGILLDNVSPAASVILTATGAVLMLALWASVAARVTANATESASAPDAEPEPTPA